jgi:hypothetical protein
MSGKPRRGPGRWGPRLGLFKLSVLVPALAVAGACRLAPAAAQAPDEAWRTIETEHFRVTFPEELEPLGRSAADRAEWAHARLREALIDPPEGVIDLVVTDHADVSNGFARVTPSNRITVYARPPVDVLSLAYFDDWLELVVLHELAHIVHLDHVGNPIGRLGRAIFGRVENEWPFFPGQATPRWLTEGLATWYESRLTEAGRVHGTFQEMQLRTALLEGRFEGIDQASGESPLWPAGNRPYAYGARFFEYLLDKHGEERMAAFVEAIAGQWVPYRLNAAGRDAFGVSLSEEWEAWRAYLTSQLDGLDERLGAAGPITEPERITTGARWGQHPTVSPDGRWLVYVRSDGRSDVQLRIADPGGGGSRQLTRTNGLATYSWMPDERLLVAQRELFGPYRSYGDLYVTDLEGRQERITHRARLGDPSVPRDGGAAVAVRQGGGTNALVRVDVVTGEISTLVAADPHVHWAFPRVSPDGRWIAATRWTDYGYGDIVLLDAATGSVVHEVTKDRAVDLAPSWGPDSHWLVWASDRTGIPNVYGVEIDEASGTSSEPVLLTNVRTGAMYPSLDPTAQWLYFSGYHVDGWEVERTRFLGSAAPSAPEPDPRFDPPATIPARGASDAAVQAYSPFPTLRPTYWEVTYREPIAFPAARTSDGLFFRRREGLGYALGAQTSGVDLVGRHAYSVLARIFTGLPRVEAGLGYSFAGLGNPVLSLSAAQSYDDAGQATAGTAPDTLFVLEREREVQAAVTLRAPRWRHDLAVTLSGALVWENRELLDRRMEPTSQYSLVRPTSRLGEIALAGSFVTARSHSFQMGMTRGLSLFAQGRLRDELTVPDSLRNVAGADRSFGEAIGRLRGAMPLWSTGRVRHVLALQLSGGAAGGPGADAGHFDVGGASGRPENLTGAELFGGSFLLFPVRGYVTSSRFGRFAWAGSAEYRFPIGLINRGLGAWPLHFDQVIGSVFFDAGNAWGPEVSPSGFTNPRRSALASLGAEVTTELLGLFDVQLRLRTGVAVPLVEGSGARVYVRVGLPF